MTEKQRSAVAKYAVDTNLFRLVSQSQSVQGLGVETAVEGAGGRNPPPKKKIFKFLLSEARKKIQNRLYLKK